MSRYRDYSDIALVDAVISLYCSVARSANSGEFRFDMGRHQEIINSRDEARAELLRRLEGREKVKQAWIDPGPYTRFHEMAKQGLMAEWPTLARAVEAL